MSLIRWRIGLGLAACVLALASLGRAAAQDSPSRREKQDHKSSDRQLYQNLTSTHNYGANLYNNGDWAGCYRLFEGSLMTLRPLLAHHPELQKTVSDALTTAQADPSLVNRAWVLREALLKVRKALAPEKGHAGKPEDGTNPRVVDKPKPKPKPTIEDKPRPKPEDKPRPKPEDKPKPKPEDKPRPKPEDKPKPKPEDKPKPTIEDKPRPKPEDKPKPKPEDKPKPKPEEKPRPRPEDKPRPKPEQNPPVARKTLWDRLGGEKGVSHIVDDVVATSARDPKVNFFRGGKYKVDAAGIRRLKEHMLQQASEMTGGPLHYEGESMKQAHKGMGITNSEFNAFLGHVKDALEKNKVDPTDSAAVLSALGSKRKDIVEKKKPEEKKPADKPEEKKPADTKPLDRPEEKKPVDKKPADSPTDKKPVDKKPADPFAPRTDKKPSPDRPADKKPAEIKTGEQGRVTGKVTFQGKPIANGELKLHPATGKSISAAITDGNYSVDVLPGEYTVTIKAEKVTLPDRYKDRSISGLHLNVKRGMQVVDLEIK